MAFLGNIVVEDIDEVTNLNQEVLVEFAVDGLVESQKGKIAIYIKELVRDIQKYFPLETPTTIRIIPGRSGSYQNNIIELGIERINQIIVENKNYSPVFEATFAHEYFHYYQSNARKSEEFSRSKQATINNKKGAPLMYDADVLEYEANLFALIFIQRRLEVLKLEPNFHEEEIYQKEIDVRTSMLERTRRFIIQFFQVVESLEDQGTKGLLKVWLLLHYEQIDSSDRTVSYLKELVSEINGERQHNYFFSESVTNDGGIIFFRDNFDSAESMEKFIKSLEFYYKSSQEDPYRKVFFHDEKMNNKFKACGFELKGDVLVDSKGGINFVVEDFEGREIELTLANGGVSCRALNKNDIDLGVKWLAFIAEFAHKILINYK
jgi:hypothetical protein